MKDKSTFGVDIKHLENMKFEVSFDHEEMGKLITDETTEVGGEGSGPTPGMLLAASLLNCMMASFLYCLNKKRIDVDDFKGDIKATIERVDDRLRITKLDAVLKPEVEDKEKIQQCIKIFEDYCIVTQSVKNGIDIDVKVEA